MDNDDNDNDKNDDGMMFMVADILVARMEQVRRLTKDLNNDNEDQKIFIKQAILILLESCELKFSRLSVPKHDNGTPIN